MSECKGDTNLYSNKVILWAAQLNKVQEKRMWQRLKKKLAQHLLANYQVEEAGPERRTRKNQHGQRRRQLEAEWARETTVSSLQILPQQRWTEMWNGQKERGGKSLSKVAAIRVEWAGRVDKPGAEAAWLKGLIWCFRGGNLLPPSAHGWHDICSGKDQSLQHEEEPGVHQGMDGWAVNQNLWKGWNHVRQYAVPTEGNATAHSVLRSVKYLICMLLMSYR